MSPFRTRDPQHSTGRVSEPSGSRPLRVLDICIESQWKAHRRRKGPLPPARTLEPVPLLEPFEQSTRPFTAPLFPSKDFFSTHPLIAATLSTKTRSAYLNAFLRFETTLRFIPSSPTQVDDILSSYIQEMFDDDPSPGNRQHMSNLLSFIVLASPQLRHSLGLSRRTISGWHKLCPSQAHYRCQGLLCLRSLPTSLCIMAKLPLSPWFYNGYLTCELQKS